MRFLANENFPGDAGNIQVVADPKAVRIFRSDGSVDELANIPDI